MIRTLPLYGTIAVGGRYFSYWRKNVLSRDLKLRIPMSDIEGVRPTRAFGFHVWGLAIQITGSPDVRLDFHSHDDRDAAVAALKKAIETYGREKAEADASALSGGMENLFARSATQSSAGGYTLTSSTSGVSTPIRSGSILSNGSTSSSATLAEEMERRRTAPLGENLNKHGRVTFPTGSKLLAKLVTAGDCKITIPPKRFVLLTIGSRGDVQVYIVSPSMARWRSPTILMPHCRAWPSD